MNQIIRLKLSNNTNQIEQFLEKIDMIQDYTIIDLLNKNRKESKNINDLLRKIEENPYDSELLIKVEQGNNDTRFNNRMLGNRFYSNEIIKPEYFIEKKINGETYKEISLEIACSNPLL